MKAFSVPSIYLSVHLSVCPYVNTYYLSVTPLLLLPNHLNNNHRLLPFSLSHSLRSTPKRFPLPIYYHLTALSCPFLSCPCPYHCALCTFTSPVVILIFISSLPLRLLICIYLSLFLSYCLPISISVHTYLSYLILPLLYPPHLSQSHPLIPFLHSQTVL
jgi:hypothetical protein